ncbi:hypothetical protein FOS14_06405 [Skermania sp. ID1734]|uniref:hypothetical protein n=1 Tax=Skermania sp. ID1734 TaxID=2597516 RepID=UPI00117EA8EB|nr:hypothetical protein [Skermania sp. ID1734]TSE00658.1 hypothetical protein FOS14_06405 [Skermania sp. ID1734]
MNLRRWARGLVGLGVIGAAFIAPGVAAAAPPVPFPQVVQMLGCGQQFPFTLTFLTAQSGPEVGPGQIRVQAQPAVPWAGGANRMGIGWLNTNTLAAGFVPLNPGPGASLWATINSGPGNVVLTATPLDPSLCQMNGTIGMFQV